MTPQDNMLEVFRQAGKSPSEPAVGSGGPFVGGGGGGGGYPGGGGGGGARGLVLLGSIAIAFVLGVAVGRQLFGDHAARASGPDDEATGEGRSWIDDGAAETSASGVPADVDRLYDPALRHTVVVVTYGNTATQQTYAWNTYDHLVAKGVEVFPPLSRGNNIVVLAGAAEEQEQLAGLQVRIRSLEGWDGKADAFKTAYVEQIDRLVDR